MRDKQNRLPGELDWVATLTVQLLAQDWCLALAAISWARGDLADVRSALKTIELKLWEIPIGWRIEPLWALAPRLPQFAAQGKPASRN